MKLPITDKFLWSLYNLVEKIDRIYEFLGPKTMKEVICPDVYKMKREWERKQARKNFSKLVHYLKKRGFIKIKNLEAKEAMILTKKGLKKVFKVWAKNLEKKRRKDGKWIMIIFEIPERKRKLRDLLREYLQLLGYRMLQQSVWICPFDVLKETEAFLRVHSLDPYVKIFLIEETE